MKPLMIVGFVVLALGIASLFVPIPSREQHGVKVGGVSLGVTTESEKKVSPVVSAVLVLAGVAMVIGARSRKS